MFIPHTDAEREEMLLAIGLKKLDEMFQDVPEKYRFPQLNLPEAQTEMEIMAELQEMSHANESTKDLACFLGAGAYNHYIPSAVDALIRRGELFTAYTPYQPEVSQGTLQAIFEYQSIVTSLTGMDASNASHYDGATATAEAGILAYHNFRGKRPKIVISSGVHPHYRATLRTYMSGYDGVSVVGDDVLNDPMAEPESLLPLIDSDTSLVIVQYPDFFGRIYDFTKLAEAVHAAGAIFCVAVNPMALGILKTPANFGADLVVGEGQPLGIPLSFGGPYLGIFAVRKEFVRKIAGRLVGETIDGNGKRGYVLTLTAREQHIRREKATSNICTNQGLLALCSTIYTSLLGKQGLKQVAELCYHKAHYAAEKISSIDGYSVCIDTPYFNEFAVCCPKPVSDINHHLLDHGILGGFDLGAEYPGLEGHMLVAVTEMNSKDEIDAFCAVLEEISHE